MAQQLVYGEDPEPSERRPAGPLFVPVRPGPAGCVARLFRTPVGGRTAVGFTTPLRLTDALGARQPWIRLSEPALRALTEPLGITAVTVDPRLTPAPLAPLAASVAPPRHTPLRAARDRAWDPRAVGALRVTGAAPPVGALTAWLG
ncbi:SAV_915 family protein [Streptomyces sp. NPDC017941]|uniref:SAV_915 family protein n=1 Tax=Streptomyces sp. NPDC017941 TaxID=3365018 RepID=UPI0037A3898B